MTHLGYHIYMKEVNIEKVFAERLKDLMVERNLNSVELSIKTNIPRTSISNWLLCKRSVNVDALCKFAEFFDVSTDYLLGRED